MVLFWIFEPWESPAFEFKLLGNI